MRTGSAGVQGGFLIRCGLGALLAAAVVHAAPAYAQVPAVPAASAAPAAPAAEQGQPSDFERYLQAAIRLYENLEYERALDQLERAKRFSRGVADDVTVALYEGTIRADLGEREEARAAFKTGLLLNPDAQLPVKVSPKVEREFEEVRAEVRRELAPLIAQREAERREREAAERAEAERLRAQAEAERRQREEAARRQREEQARAEQARRAQEAEKAREGKTASPPAVVVRPDDRPERPKLSQPPLTEAGRSDAFAKEPRRKPVVLPYVFGGLAVAAGGVGGYFGMQSRDSVAAARSAQGQHETANHLQQAQGSARNANILFAAAGTAAVGALISTLVATSDGGD